MVYFLSFNSFERRHTNFLVLYSEIENCLEYFDLQKSNFGQVDYISYKKFFKV